jgi:hypothetical protein
LISGEAVDPKDVLLLLDPIVEVPEKAVSDPVEAIEMESKSPEVVEELPASAPKAAATRASPISLRALESLPYPEGTVERASPAKAMSTRQDQGQPRRESPPRMPMEEGQAHTGHLYDEKKSV